MKILSSLMAYRPNAASGSVSIKDRGSSAAATTYSSFEGDGASTASSYALDAYGMAQRYVSGPVDIIVYDSDGVEVVPAYTEGDSAAAVEVIHPHWTGNSYATGASALGNPLTLIQLLNSLYTSFGKDDGTVRDVGGSASNLKSAILSLGNCFINVKDPTYGATGDGATDDTTAIQSAITAAAALTYDVSVVLPFGDYRITGVLDFSSAANVSLIGLGNAMTSVSMDHGTANYFNVAHSGPTNGRQVFAGFRCKAIQANTGKIFVDATGNATKITVKEVILGDGTNVRGSLISVVNANDFLFQDCEWRTQATAQKMFVATAAAGAGPVRVVRGKAVTPIAAGTVTLFDAKNMDIDGLELDVSASTSGTIIGFDVATGGFKSRGLRVSAIAAGGTLQMFDITNIAAPAASAGNYQNEFEENDTNIGFISGTFNMFTGTCAAPETKVIRLMSRIGRTKYVASTGGDADVDFYRYDTVVVVQSSGAAANITSTTTLAQMPLGHLTVVYRNASGGNLTPTFFSNFFKTDGASGAVPDTKTSGFIFAAEPKASQVWVEVGRAENY